MAKNKQVCIERAKFLCGCRIVEKGFDTGKVSVTYADIEYCPKHKAAPKLYEACKGVREAVGRSLRATVSYSATLDVLQIAIDQLLEALAEVEK